MTYITTLKQFTKKCVHSIMYVVLAQCFYSNAVAEDLLTIYKLAEQYDDTWLGSFETFAAAKEALPQARASFFPVINGLATQLAVHSDFPGVGSYHSSVYSLNMTQPLFNYNNIVVWNQSIFQVNQARATYAAALQDLIARTVIQYFTVLKAKDALFYAQAQRSALARFVKQTQDRFDVGLIAITDVEIAKAQHDSSLVQVINAEYAVQNERDKLQQIIYQPFCSLNTLINDIHFPTPCPNDEEEWVETSLENNYTVIAQQFLVKANCQAIHSSESGNFPILNSVGQVNTGTLNVPSTTQKSTTSSIGLQLSLPIFAGGSVNSKIRQAAHLFQKSRFDLDLLNRQTEVNTRVAYRGVITQLDQIVALKRAVESNKAALEATDAAFNVGTRTIVDVLTAQTNLITAQLNYALARYEYVIQSVKLKQAAGTLNPCDVALINTWLTCPADPPLVTLPKNNEYKGIAGKQIRALIEEKGPQKSEGEKKSETTTQSETTTTIESSTQSESSKKTDVIEKKVTVEEKTKPEEGSAQTKKITVEEKAKPQNGEDKKVIEKKVTIEENKTSENDNVNDTASESESVGVKKNEEAGVDVSQGESEQKVKLHLEKLELSSGLF